MSPSTATRGWKGRCSTEDRGSTSKTKSSRPSTILRGSDSQRLRGDRHATSDRQTWSSQGLLQSRAGRPHLRRGGEDPRERAGGKDRRSGGFRHDRRGGSGAGTVERESGRQYVVRRASERHGSTPQCPEGSQDVSIQQGLAASRGGDLSVNVHLQFLLAGSDATHQRRARMLAEAKPGHGGRVDGSCVVDLRMADVPRRAMLIGHEGQAAPFS